MRVIVVGGGIGGLAVAVGLQRASIEVVLYERDVAARATGAALSLFGNGFAALDSLGVGERVRQLAGPMPLLRAGQRRPDGRWLATTPAAATAQMRVVLRTDLHRALSSVLAPGTVRTGNRVVQADPDGQVVVVNDSPDGPRTPRCERADLIVAADGLHSRLRGGWPGDPGTRYVGWSAWRGITSRPVDLHEAAGETWGRGLRFGLAPLGDGRVYWFAVATVAEGQPLLPGTDDLSALHRRFAGWHDPIGEVLRCTGPEVVHRTAVRELAGPLPTFVRGRCVLLGDAAHAMTPDLGQGANQALEDAATLCALLTGTARQQPGRESGRGFDREPGRDLEAALARYDRLRRPRTQGVARQARRLGRLAQAPERWQAAARDLALQLVPAGVIGRRAVQLQTWQPPQVQHTGQRPGQHAGQRTAASEVASNSST
ncbi:FAD-dependent monooxygenase [Kineococcus sp. SYSU DK003]|uniref:FAD-dependent monooxygenase n=1 Tax=Kineococcus sp. SYSU DK003 TaxID=3383124 RepID=UPI003D7DCBFA